MSWYDESWKDSYDAWKLRAPDWDYEEPEFICTACEDRGWDVDESGRIFPCTECSQPIELFDIEEFRS